MPSVNAIPQEIPKCVYNNASKVIQKNEELDCAGSQRKPHINVERDRNWAVSLHKEYFIYPTSEYYELKRGLLCTFGLTPFSSVHNTPLCCLSFANLVNGFTTRSFLMLILPRTRVFGFIPPSPEAYKHTGKQLRLKQEYFPLERSSHLNCNHFYIVSNLNTCHFMEILDI